MKKIRSFISIVLALSLLIGLIPSGAFAAPESRRVPFSDVKSTDWFYEPVEYAYENGLMTGTGSSTFSPNLTTTRGMIVTILHRMEGEPDAARAAFNDVPRSRYYAEAIDWANANGIVSGYGGNRFGPDDPITREQMASIMYRYSEYKGYDTSVSASLNHFKDGSSVSSYAKEVMRWAVGSGLLSGRTADTLAPQGQTTRAEAATILMRYCETIAAASEETFTVTFDSAGGSHVASQEVKSGGQAKEPADPTRDGYKFIGWQLENAFGLYNFDASIFADITLVAQWEADDFEAAHEEFESKDIYDFDSDRVLQVEESNTEDNFAVVAEDVELIKDDGVTNQVNIANRATDVYVLSNITDDVRSLQPGDKLMLVSDSNVDNNISVSVENITFAGNTATISSEGSSLEDFYEYIDIEKLYPAEEEHVEILSSMDISDTPIEGEGGIEVASAPDLLDRSLVGKAIGGGVTVSEEFEASLIYPKDAKKEDALITGSTSAAIALSVDVEWAPKIFSEDYLRCDVIANLSAVNDYDINFLNVQKDISIPLYSIKMPLGVTGLVVEGDIDLTAGCSGYLHGSFDSIYSKNIGFSYNTNDGYHEVNETEKDDASIIVDAKATANIGLGADLTLSAVTVLGATVRTELGAEAEVTGEKDFLADNSDHRCFLCFDGDLGLYAEGRFILRATIFDIEEEFLNEELYHATVPLGEFYCSLLNEGGAYSFGWGECPYKNAGPVEEEKPPEEEPGNNLFNELPSKFVYSSGAGGWATELTLNDDGSFTGQYYNYDLGITGANYPNGTVYICDFTGNFSTPQKISEYVYSMEMESLEAEGTPDSIYYENGIRYIVAKPYGLLEGRDYRIYLPGCPQEDLDDGFIGWASIDFDNRDILPVGVYGIYNVANIAGFVGRTEESPWYKDYVYYYGSYRSELWPRYSNQSSLNFWPASGAATLSVRFDWNGERHAEITASDYNGTGDYNLTLDFNNNYTSVKVILESLSGTSLESWGGTADGKLTAEYKLT